MDKAIRAATHLRTRITRRWVACRALVSWHGDYKRINWCRSAPDSSQPTAGRTAYLVKLTSDRPAPARPWMRLASVLLDRYYRVNTAGHEGV